MMYESDADGRMDHLAPTGQPRHPAEMRQRAKRIRVPGGLCSPEPRVSNQYAALSHRQRL